MWNGPVGKVFFAQNPSDGAVICPASHDDSSVKDFSSAIRGGALVPADFLRTSHPAGIFPDHCPSFGTGELQENGTTL